MAAVASVPIWIPEDDLLLKNAVEAGASLEALAKGAVRFSRKFTVRELRDRWHSLLYDPAISAEASARMVEYELSVSTNSSILRNKSVQVPVKRKAMSLRQQYYALRKRMCGQAFESFELSINSNGGGDTDKLVKVGYEGNGMIGDDIENHFGFQNRRVDMLNRVPPQIRKHVAANAMASNDREVVFEKNDAQKDKHSTLGDNLVEFGNGSDAEDLGPSYVMPDMPIWKTIEDVPAPAMPINMSIGDKDQGAVETLILPENVDGEKMSSSGYHVVHSEQILKDRHSGDAINSSAAISEGDFVDLSDCLLNLASEDELLFMDEDGKDTVDKSCYDNVSSILLSSPSNVHNDDAHNVCEPQTSVLNTCLASSDGACTEGLDVIADPSHSGRGDQLSICSSQVDMPSSTVDMPSSTVEMPSSTVDMPSSTVDMSSSTSVPDPLPPDLHGGEIHCTLNTEDPDIPCNDDICLPDAFASSAILPNYKEANNPSSSSSHQRNGEQEKRLKKKDSPTVSFIGSRLVRPGTMPETSPKHSIVGFGVKPGLSQGNHLAVDSKEITIVQVDPRQGRLAHATPKLAIDEAIKIEETNAPDPVREHAMLHAQPGSTKLEPDPTVDQEESDDDDIPCFSDIETMILEMDLCPDDEDSYINREVSRYQHEGTKRTIIRLEQCARSSMQRAIASQGALAILYGRHLKQYIKKTEVILGRATDDTAVDIDLGREGRANKVSRQQALIKMKEDGSFYLKNLGKSSIFLNGKEVARGQLLSLNSGSLIEIREMAFVFELNHKSVRKYLAKVAKKSQEKSSKFEWLPEEGCQ